MFIVYMLLVCCTLSAKEPVGLNNLGNTCYQNASLQCLYNIKDLTEFLLKKKGTDYYQNAVATAYIDLVDTLQKATAGSLAPTAFCSRALTKFGFKVNEQQDAHEFVTKLLEYLADYDVAPQYKGRYGYPLQKWLKTNVGELFDIVLESTVTCKVCKSESITYEPQMMLSLEVVAPEGKKLATLAECLGSFTQLEVVDYYCEVCNSKDKAEKRLHLFTAPSTLIIGLKRWKWKPDGTAQKINDPIKVPLQFNATPFFSPTSLQRPAAQYELTGITIHSGGVGGGHYWAYVKTADGTWYEANDSAVTKIDEAHIKKFETQGYINRQEETPYVLYYRRTQALPAIIPITEAQLRTKLQQGGITDAMLSSFLAYETTEKRVTTTVQTLVDGSNGALITPDTLIADIKRVNQLLTEKLKRHLITLTISLQALARSLAS